MPQQRGAGQRGGGRGQQQRLVAGQQLRSQARVQGQRWDDAAVGAGHVGIGRADDVQHYLVVLGIDLMVVPRPIRSPQVDFNGPVPFHLA